MIDPVATVIAYLADAPRVRDAVGVRVAAKHKYGLGLSDNDTQPDAWKVGAQALRIQPASGTPDLDTAVQRLDLQATCFGESQARAMAVYRAVVATCRETQRTRVPTADGDALLYLLVAVGAPVFGFEPLGDQAGVDTVTFTLRAAVSECPLPALVAPPPPPEPVLTGWLPGMVTGLIAPPTYTVAYEVV